MPYNLELVSVVVLGVKHVIILVLVIALRATLQIASSYYVNTYSECMNCSTKNVIYLISCKKCGIQYVGKTSQTLKSCFNNHRARLKQMCDIFTTSAQIIVVLTILSHNTVVLYI